MKASIRTAFVFSFAVLGLVSNATRGADPSYRAGPTYRVHGIEFEYVKPFAGLPDPMGFFDLELPLTPVADGWSMPAAGDDVVTVTIGSIGRDGPVTIDADVLAAISATVADAHRDLSLTVAPSEREIDPANGADLRPREREALLFRVAYEGPVFEVSRFEPHYAIGDHVGQVTTNQILRNVKVMLTPSDQGYVTWRPGVAPVELQLSELDGRGTRRFSAMAIQIVLESISDYLVEHQFMGVWARPAPGELGPALADGRQGRTEFHIEIVTGFVGGIRTIARGDRFADEDSINLPAHAFVKQRAPVQPALPGRAGPEHVLRKDELDDFLFRLSRHPGRRVDMAIGPGVEPFSVNLDFLVTENDESIMYIQAADTGTEQTKDWRYRVGLFNNQLTGNDDILNLEYVTADFEDNNSVSLSYEVPAPDNDRVRGRVYGQWSEFEASEVGFANESFTGESWSAGAELIINTYQKRQTFVDLVLGLRFADIEVNNPVVFVSGDESLLLPYVGMRMEHHTAEASTDLSATVEWNPSNVTGTSERDLESLGRLFPDNNWVLLRWDTMHSMFLEPVLNREAWADIATPESSTLAHELLFRFRGQYSFEHRLIPQMEQVAGGFYTVRGYPESVAVGDTVLLGTVEYRFHLPRAFGFSEQPVDLFNEPFRVVPQQPYGAADWDLILRGFFDIGRTLNTRRFSFENDETLMGVGVGLEFAYRSNLNVRVDWGVALEELEGEVRDGSSQLHFVGTIFF